MPHGVSMPFTCTIQPYTYTHTRVFVYVCTHMACQEIFGLSYSARPNIFDVSLHSSWWLVYATKRRYYLGPCGEGRSFIAAGWWSEVSFQLTECSHVPNLPDCSMPIEILPPKIRVHTQRVYGDSLHPKSNTSTNLPQEPSRWIGNGLNDSR